MKTKFYFSNVLAIATIIICNLFSNLSFGQSTPTFYNANASTTSNTFPLGGATNRVQWVYPPNIFKTAGSTGTPSGGGTITRIYFRLGSLASATNTNTDYTISLGQTYGTATTFTSATWITGLTTCFYQATYQMTGATANSWYGITLQTPFSYDPNKSLIFEIKVSSTVGGNYVAQSALDGRIWGTYTGTAGTGFGTGLVDFGIDLAKGSNDASISNITTPLCSPTMVATFMNQGVNNIDSVKVNWSVDGTVQSPQIRYNTVRAPGQTAPITLTTNYPFVDGTTYNIRAWTSLPNNKKDTLPKNDTFKLTFKYQGPAGIKSVNDIIKCGPGQVMLSAVPLNAADSIVWFNAPTAGSVIARGKNALTPPLVLGVNTYYAQAFKIGSPTAFANAMTPSVGYGSTYSGGFADITPNKGIIIDSFAVVMTANIQNATWNVWMRTGTYVGYNLSPTGWTKIGNNVVARVRQVGTYWRSYIKIPETSLNQGQTYGFYVTSTPTTPCSPWCNAAGAINISNADINVMQAQISYGATEFAAGLANYNMTWETHYRPSNCPSSRVPVQVTVKPSPNGATIIKSTPFQTTQPNTSGSVGSPDIVAKGDKLTYEITPPTGYNNIDYGTTWIMKGFTMRTAKGTIIPSSYYSPANPTPSGAANAKFTFTADPAVVDSTIIMTVSVFDLGPHYCDSLLTRNIFVAPRPVSDFKFPQPVCNGDKVIFTNTSIVSSGNLTHRWNFNTGNPADTSTDADVVFTFPTNGTYDVILKTKTVPYGYEDSKTIQVVVTEIPKIGFKVFNACLGDSIRFVNATTISSGTILYNWDFGNGKNSIKESPKYKYNVAGGYKVTLTATSNGCSQTLTKNAQQFARPVAKFTVPSKLCDKTDINFVNGSTISIGNMGYTWNFGDGSVSGFASPVHSYSTPGAKSVKMKAVSEFGCADSSIQTVNLLEAPLATFTNGPVCNLNATQFTFTGTKPAGGNTVFVWDFAGESISNQENPTKLFSITGKKMVTLNLTSANGCTDKVSKEVDVKLQSKADFDVSDVCEGNEAVFTNKSTVTSGNLIYQWKFGDASTSNIQSPRHMYKSGPSATYNVTLVAIVPDGCSDSISKPVTSNANPVSDFTFKTSGRKVSFDAIEKSHTTYNWDFGNGASASTPVAEYNYLNSFATSKFKVCLTTTNAAGCITQTCKEVGISNGIQNLDKLTGVKIFPNPNKGNFNITVEDPKSDLSIDVYDLLGHQIKTVNTNNFKSTYQVDLNVANGVYLVKVTNGGLSTSQKITVNK
jgi:PKD repeat protein